MKKILIDTDVLINYSFGFNKKLNELIKKQNNNELQLYTNPIIIAEFLNNKKLDKKKDLIHTEEFLDEFNSVIITKETARIVGGLLRKQTIPFLADAFIAASCLQFNLQLYTNNKKASVSWASRYSTGLQANPESGKQ